MKLAVTVKGARAARSYAAAPIPTPRGANQRAGVAGTFGKNAECCK
jgi:hypothetical protein